MSINSGILIPPGDGGGGGIDINGTIINTMTVNNALEFDGVSETLQFGGDLVKNTEVDVQTFGLTFKDEGNDLIKFGVTDGAIDVITTAFSFDPTAYGITGNEILGVTSGGIVTPAIVENGLSFDVTGSDKVLKLGGSLTENTIISGLSSYNLTYQISSTSHFLKLEQAGNNNNTKQITLVGTIISGTLRAGIVVTQQGHEIRFYTQNGSTSGYLWFRNVPPTGGYGTSATGYRFSTHENTGLTNQGTVFSLNDNACIGYLTPDQLKNATPYNLYFSNTSAAPTKVDHFKIYSNDANGAGTAAAHIETEDNKTIILYPFNTYGAPTGTATRTTFDTATVTLSELAERVKALIDDLQTNGIIG